VWSGFLVRPSLTFPTPPLKFRTLSSPPSGFKPRCLSISPTLPESTSEVKHQVCIPPRPPSLIVPSSLFGPPALRVGFSDHPTSGLRCDHHGPRVLGSERVMLSRSSSLLRPDPPVSPTPAAFPGPLVIRRVFARRPGLGCPRDLPCFGSPLLPYVLSPLRREEERGTPVLPHSPRPSSTEHGVGSSISPHPSFGEGFANDAAVFASCYGPQSCLPSWTGPTWSITPAAEDFYSRACPRPVTRTPSRVSLHSPPGGELWPDFHRLECCRYRLHALSQSSNQNERNDHFM
jgi:hypothetical protein